ncbi:MAG TPA: elongation factor Ts [Dehalococcoidia bacterium]|nr:elongation factor Ts [Dehalococcoidia bacterium]
MQISTEAIRELRDKTGAGIMECKRALQDADGNIEAAAEKLIERGYEIAKKKENRIARQGLVESYVHAGGRIGALVEINCESDFVARTPEFKELAHDLAMQVVATCPSYVGAEDIPEGTEFEEEDCLLLQPFIKDPGKKVQDIIAEAVAKVRENVKIRRFIRFELGVDGQDEQSEV